jgi:hypothetical protein
MVKKTKLTGYNLQHKQVASLAGNGGEIDDYYKEQRLTRTSSIS